MRPPLRLLLDTNVWLDQYLPGRSGSDDSRGLILLAQERGDLLLYSARSLVDIHYQIARCYKVLVRAERGEVSQQDAIAIAEIAWGCIDNLCELGVAVGLDEADIWLARKYRAFNRDFEDNFVMAAAERAKANFVVTSDQGLLKRSTVAALTPADALALLSA